ncbi:MAG: SMI1/KNR4 family protein [Solobacterium sp.]|nr:SMI1/KNR4 family protein [Solobacterium sp.]
MAKGNEYLEKLAEAYGRNGLKTYWDHLMAVSKGISEEDRAALLAEYPEFPSSLMEILERIDGTYFRQYGDEEVTYFFFGSDVDDGEYPYYLFSTQDILENRDSAQNFGDLIYHAVNEPDENFGPFFDQRISAQAEQNRWLNFADCMNNGGTSTLYIDFTPSESGRKGQVIRFLHDPDELKVIADSFDDYLDMLMEKGFAFLHPDDGDWFS